MTDKDYTASDKAERPRLDLNHEQLRANIATAAMQGLIAGGYQWEVNEIARAAVAYADALIKELKK